MNLTRTFVAEKNNLRVRLEIEPAEKGYAGTFRIEKTDGTSKVLQAFISNPYAAADEFSLIKLLIFNASRQKNVFVNPHSTEELLGECWKKFFDSKQNKLNFNEE